MLVNVWHGGYGVAASADACKAADCGRSGRRRLGDQRRAAGVNWWIRGIECPRAQAGGQRGRVGARRGRLRVEQNRLGHGGRLVLGDDDAAIARVLQVDFREWAVMGRAGRPRIELAIAVVEGAALRVEQMSCVRLVCGRVEGCCRGARGACAAAEELANHDWQWAHASMRSWACCLSQQMLADLLWARVVVVWAPTGWVMVQPMADDLAWVLSAIDNGVLQLQLQLIAVERVMVVVVGVGVIVVVVVVVDK